MNKQKNVRNLSKIWILQRQQFWSILVWFLEKPWGTLQICQKGIGIRINPVMNQYMQAQKYKLSAFSGFSRDLKSYLMSFDKFWLACPREQRACLKTSLQGIGSFHPSFSISVLYCCLCMSACLCIYLFNSLLTGSFLHLSIHRSVTRSIGLSYVVLPIYLALSIYICI